MEPTIYILSGYNQRAVIAFLRYLNKAHYDNYKIIATTETDPIFKTVYKNHVCYVRKSRNLTVDELENAFKFGGGFLAPTAEALIRFSLASRKILKEWGIGLPVVDEFLYKKVSDKAKFWKICRMRGLKVPELIKKPYSSHFPIVAKPKQYHSKDGNIYSPIIISSKDELTRFFEKYNMDDFDIQEFVEGESYYLLYYIERNGTVHSFSQRNYLQQPAGKSILAAKADGLHKTQIGEVYYNLLKSLGFFGFIMIELRKQGGEYYMIEANPRFWGPSQLFEDAGVDFFGCFLKDCGVKITVQEDNTSYDYEARYYWGSGRNNHNVLNDIWLKGGQEEFRLNEELYKMNDLYNRPDTMELYKQVN